jgi:hypothetical protein
MAAAPRLTLAAPRRKGHIDRRPESSNPLCPRFSRRRERRNRGLGAGPRLRRTLSATKTAGRDETHRGRPDPIWGSPGSSACIGPEYAERMRRNILITLIGVVLSVAACGGDEDRADTRPRQPPTTTDAPTPGTDEASTPGSGGFIETPQAKVDKAARDAPDTFEGEERQIYGQAKTACAGFPQKVARRNLTLFADVLARGDKTRRRAALEGCRAGLK